MRKYIWMVAIAALVVATLACNAVMGTGNNQGPEQKSAPETEATRAIPPGLEPETLPATEPAAVPVEKTPSAGTYNTEFPLPQDISNFIELGNGAINFQAKLSVKDAIGFYRDSLGKQGYKEREINTAITDATFSLVFDGHSSGKAIVVQGVDMGSGSVNINIRFEDV